MPSTFTVYDGSSEIQLQTATPIRTVYALASHNRHLYVVNERRELLCGYVEIGATAVDMETIKSDVIGVECSRSDQRLYTIDSTGSVHQLAIVPGICQKENPEWSELVVPNPRKCPHGVKSTSEKVRIASINSNCDGVLFTSTSGELFGMGNFGEVLRATEPVPVECFSGIKVLQVTMGDHFVVVLTQQNVASLSSSVSRSSRSECSDVLYVNTECAKCAPDDVRARVDVATGGSTTTTSVASSGSQSDVFELNDVWSSLHPEKSAPVVAAGALRSHKDTALSFLMDTLSLNGGDEGGVQSQRLLRANVSNITSLVREGVRTLSRHMSGSDTNEVTDDEDMNAASTAEQHQDDDMEHAFDRSARTDLSADEGDSSMVSALELPSECEMEAKIAKLFRLGEETLGTTVWCFGAVNKGHLGSGDHIRRTRINEVLGLSGQGVVSIASGSEHSTAVTLDGRLFMWGSNAEQQITTDDVEDVSIPKRYRNGRNVWAATCGRQSTTICLNNLTVREIRRGHFGTSRPFYVTEEAINPTHILMSANEFMVQNHCQPSTPNMETHLAAEQRHLQESLKTYLTVLKPLLKKLNFTTKNPHIEDLCQLYLNLVQLTATTVRSLRAYFRGTIGCLELHMLVHSRELIAVYRRYMHRLCDILAQPGGFAAIVELQSYANSESLFEAPLRRVWKNIDLIGDLRKTETVEVYLTFLSDRLAAWERCKSDKDVAIEQARNTCRFWDNAGRSLTSRLYVVDRRLVLDSKTVALKWPSSGRFASHWWMLFNDVFCRCSGVTGELHVYPLKTLWVAQSRGSLRVVTPEETFVLSDPTKVWFGALAAGVRRSLDRPARNGMPSHRNASYTFGDKHAKYARAKYFGRWQEGQMHGMGHLEFADGRVFNGQMVCGEMMGYGRMFTPGVGIYEGEFVAGKYHGFGVLEMNDHKTYKGHFRDGVFGGHGVLRTDAYTYIGEFANGMKCGYGVLDDAFGGDKYMGMFVDERRSGFGMAVTMDGNHFEGIFVADVLDGEGVAVFKNGSYYEGELTMSGPNGKGTMFMPTMEVKSEMIELDDYNIEIRGNLLTGNLSGKWTDIRVNHGNVLMDQSFAKVPRSLSLLGTDYNRKWQSLFGDWEFDVFGGTSAAMTHAQLWQKFAVFQVNAKHRANLHMEDHSFAVDDWAHELPDTTRNQSRSDAISIDRISLSSRLSQRSSGSKTAHLSEVSADGCAAPDNKQDQAMYDSNLRTEAPPLLTEMFRGDKRDAAEKLLNEQQRNGSEDSSSLRNSAAKSVFVPSFGVSPLDRSDLEALKTYLVDSFRTEEHPFGALNARISFCFYTSYGCWKVKPNAILSMQAMHEWEAICRKIYVWVRRMFPALPIDGGDIEGELVSHRSLLNPILLSDRVYSTMFVLYASKCSNNDELYRQRMLVCDKKSDEELADFLRIESNLLPMIKSTQFDSAITCLKQVKEKYCPRQMLDHIENTFRLIDLAKNEILGDIPNVLSADNTLPLTIFLVLRAGIPHLGAEIQLMEDLMGGDFEPIMTGFAGYCFITIKATYQHIISSKFFQD